FVDPTGGASFKYAGGVVCRLFVSGQELGSCPASSGEGGMAPWRTVSSCRIYRDQSNPARQTGGAVLQPARHGGAVDQGRQERGQMDEAVLSRLCGQSGATAPVRAGL